MKSVADDAAGIKKHHQPAPRTNGDALCSPSLKLKEHFADVCAVALQFHFVMNEYIDYSIRKHAPIFSEACRKIDRI
jgi:hypothetical protein